MGQLTANQAAADVPARASGPRRGLSRTEAASYVGVSPSLFDEMVKDGRMPKPKRINARTVWDLRKLDVAFDNLPGDEESDEANEWTMA